MHQRKFAAIILLLIANASLASDIPEPIHNPHSNKVLISACAETELASLKKHTYAAANTRRPDQAWALAFTMLCGSGKASQRLIARYTPALVATESYGTGNEVGPSYKLQPRNSVTLLKKNAFGAEVQVIDSDIMFWYQPAGVCTGGFRLRYISSAWLIVSVGTACD